MSRDALIADIEAEFARTDAAIEADRELQRDIDLAIANEPEHEQQRLILAVIELGVQFELARARAARGDLIDYIMRFMRLSNPPIESICLIWSQGLAMIETYSGI